MNMDWSLCEALASTNIGDIGEILHIYDINCQYCRYLPERILRNQMLQIPDHITISPAIGLFHVHGHKSSCLYRYATSYVPGAGIVDGEVLETLWSVLNSVAATTRTASLAHRAEVLDDHMNDSNWKKMIGIGIYYFYYIISLLHTLPLVKAIIRRYHRATENVVDARIAFDNLNEAAPAHCVAEWESTIETAEGDRQSNPAAMDVMHSKIKSGQTMKQITAELMREDGMDISAVPDNGDNTEWLLNGLNLEDDQ
jgi:hypothetical protein